jgi:hypothetical protein
LSFRQMMSTSCLCWHELRLALFDICVLLSSLTLISPSPPPRQPSSTWSPTAALQHAVVRWASSNSDLVCFCHDFLGLLWILTLYISFILDYEAATEMMHTWFLMTWIQINKIMWLAILFVRLLHKGRLRSLVEKMLNHVLLANTDNTYLWENYLDTSPPPALWYEYIFFRNTYIMPCKQKDWRSFARIHQHNYDMIPLMMCCLPYLFGSSMNRFAHGWFFSQIIGFSTNYQGVTLVMELFRILQAHQ